MVATRLIRGYQVIARLMLDCCYAVAIWLLCSALVVGIWLVCVW